MVAIWLAIVFVIISFFAGYWLGLKERHSKVKEEKIEEPEEEVKEEISVPTDLNNTDS